jgi:hypothetical protein
MAMYRKVSEVLCPPTLLNRLGFKPHKAEFRGRGFPDLAARHRAAQTKADSTKELGGAQKPRDVMVTPIGGGSGSGGLWTS